MNLQLLKPGVSRHYSSRTDINTSIRCNATNDKDQSTPRIHKSNTNPPVLTDSPILLKLTASVIAYSTLGSILASPAQAAGWHPRRHRSGLTVEQMPLQREITTSPKSKQAAMSPSPSQSSPSSWLSDLQHTINTSLGLKPKTKKKPSPYLTMSISEPTKSSSSFSPPSSYYGSPSGTATFGGSGFILASAALLAVLGLTFKDKIAAFVNRGRGRGGEGGGRWIRDRSLGGRLIFVPDVDTSSSSSSESGGGTKKATRPLWEDDDDDDGVGGKAGSSNSNNNGNGGGYSSSSEEAAFTSAAAPPPSYSRKNLIPDWWSPPSTAVYSTPQRKEDLKKQTRMILKQLQDEKLRGLDYSIASLVTLRMLCQEGGGLSVKPATESGRNSMFRAGVIAAIQCAQEGSNAMLSAYDPAGFVSGLASDLTVPQDKAINITHGEVAAAARALLIQAEAAHRAKDGTEILMVLVRLSGMLTMFPLPPNSAEAEMVAASTKSQAQLELRKAIFFVAGTVDKGTAPIVAEMLGFNPELVMPQLDKYLEEEERKAAEWRQEE